MRALTKIMNRVRGLVRRGVIGTSDSSGAGQTVQAKLLAGDVADAVEHFEPYGFTSHPPAGSEGLVFAVGGERAHAVGINFGDRGSRLAGLEQGEAAMYHPSGSSIIMRNDGSIEIVAAPGETVNIGGVPPDALPVARETDPVAPNADMVTWMGQVNAAITAMAAPFNVSPPAPMSSLGAGAVTPPSLPPNPFADIFAGGSGSTST